MAAISSCGTRINLSLAMTLSTTPIATARAKREQAKIPQSRYPLPLVKGTAMSTKKAPKRKSFSDAPYRMTPR